MKNPENRIMLYPVGTFDVEILILGEPEKIAGFVAEVKGILERWIGFSHVQPIAMGSQVIGFTAQRDKLATHDDPIAEAMLMLRRFDAIGWADGGPRCGMVGTW